MKKSTRTFLFCFLSGLFLIAVPITVFYSLGWRLNWENNQPYQVGMFYFKVWPRVAEIYLDGKLAKKTDLIFGSRAIENLLPGDYIVEIKKEGFHAWKKSLTIKNGQVTEARDIILVPTEPNFTLIRHQVQSFVLAPDGRKIILKEGVAGQWDLVVFDTKNNIPVILFPKSEFSASPVDLLDSQISLDSKNALLKVSVGTSIKYYLLALDQNPAVLSPVDLTSDKADLYFSPDDSKKILVFDQGVLREFDSETKESRLLLENVIAFYPEKNNLIYYLDKTGSLFSKNIASGATQKISVSPIFLESNSYKLEKHGSNIVLKQDNTLYFFDSQENVFKKAGFAQNYVFSPDSKKIVYSDGKNITILFLEASSSQPQREYGENILFLGIPEGVDDIFWYTNSYLIFRAKDKIKIAEIDICSDLNIVDFSQFPALEKMFWSEVSKKAYLISQGNLYISEKTAP